MEGFVRFLGVEGAMLSSARGVVLAAGTWLLLAAAGLAALWNFASTPGRPGVAAPWWPAESRLARAPDQPTLVMLVHPRCPCSRASLGELARILAHVGGRLSAHVLFVKPASAPTEWEESDLWESAASLPGVDVVVDEGGEEARNFGAATSGQTLLYDAAGRLRFSGGITAGRGHFGDNAGADAILALLGHGVVAHDRTGVFGCALGELGARELQESEPWSR